MRRAGKVLTGVDRVELAYLRAVLADPVPAFGLIRSRLGYILLDQAGMGALETYLSGPKLGSDSDRLSRAAWQQARRLSIARVPPPLLGLMLRRHLPQRTAYLNVGHSNLTDRVMQTLHRSVNARTTVFVHDVIPLEFPEFQRDGTVAPFSAMIGRVAKHADRVIYNSQDTQTRAKAWMKPAPPPSIVAHLGTELAPAAPGDLPQALVATRPYFVCVGTIEPRKNHAFLLDIWDQMGPNAPGLVIAGARGWNNEEVFARLDTLPAGGPVTEVAGLTDGALGALIEGAAAVLFPSHAEGYGLPAVEAAARGVPLIANDLSVFREILGDIPIYASVSDRYLWITKIKSLAAEPYSVSGRVQFHPPTWDAHFKSVLSLT